MADCPFWREARSYLYENFNHSRIERYLSLTEYFYEMYGDDTILVDSSKNWSSMLAELEKKVELKIVFLVRDFRSWCYSRHSRHGTSLIKLVLQWLKGNLSFKRKLNSLNLSYMIVGYEEFALYPEYILKLICKYLDIEFNSRMLEPSKTTSHILRGNVVRGDKSKSSRILYDARWFTSTQIGYLSFLCSPLMKLNRKWVYSAFIKGSSKAFGREQTDFIIFGNKAKEIARKAIEGR